MSLIIIELVADVEAEVDVDLARAPIWLADPAVCCLCPRDIDRSVVEGRSVDLLRTRPVVTGTDWRPLISLRLIVDVDWLDWLLATDV